MTEDRPPGVPLFPPDWCVENFNAGAFAHGLPLRSAFDPLVMLGWHLASTGSYTSVFVTGLPAL